MLFASAHPFVDYREALKNYAKLPLNDDVRENVMFKNAARILGLVGQQDEQPDKAHLEKMIIESVIKELAKRGMIAG
ncbi:hypothetical protein SDC9_203286 [bioreactor metagenome]|uniref:Amidohydrolase-related domain-containing protein n=1 Tax=bioreactor metagenome TaxID=1076179 RepID=A0A645IXM6_9ZZZZ